MEVERNLTIKSTSKIQYRLDEEFTAINQYHISHAEEIKDSTNINQVKKYKQKIFIIYF